MLKTYLNTGLYLLKGVLNPGVPCRPGLSLKPLLGVNSGLNRRRLTGFMLGDTEGFVNIF